MMTWMMNDDLNAQATEVLPSPTLPSVRVFHSNRKESSHTPNL